MSADPTSERRQRLHDEREVPEGYEMAAVPSARWRPDVTRRCRWTVGPGHKQCQQPSVAAINRKRLVWGKGWADSWWGYCIDHMYGNWIEDGQVMHWILREKRADG